MYNKCNPEIYKDIYQKELNRIFPPNKDNIKNYINNGLLVSYSIIKGYDSKIYKKKVYIFTNNDDPLKNDEEEKNICLKTVK